MVDKQRSGRQTLSAESWVEGALDMIAFAGLEAVAVEPLARRLHVTKGSFYWHFPNRDALIKQVLESWERKATEDIMHRAESEPDPRTRIYRLFQVAASAEARTERIFLALSTSDHPLAKASIQAIGEQWRAHLGRSYRSLGMEAQLARNWATLAYSTLMGTIRVRWEEPAALPARAMRPTF